MEITGEIESLEVKILIMVCVYLFYAYFYATYGLVLLKVYYRKFEIDTDQNANLVKVLPFLKKFKLTRKWAERKEIRIGSYLDAQAAQKSRRIERDTRRSTRIMKDQKGDPLELVGLNSNDHQQQHDNVSSKKIQEVDEFLNLKQNYYKERASKQTLVKKFVSGVGKLTAIKGMNTGLPEGGDFTALNDSHQIQTQTPVHFRADYTPSNKFAADEDDDLFREIQIDLNLDMQEGTGTQQFEGIISRPSGQSSEVFFPPDRQINYDRDPSKPSE